MGPPGKKRHSTVVVNSRNVAKTEKSTKGDSGTNGVTLGGGGTKLKARFVRYWKEGG